MAQLFLGLHHILSARSFVATINSTSSAQSLLHIGVHKDQSSVLSHSLSTLFLSVLLSLIHLSVIISYAVDTQLVISFVTFELYTSIAHLQPTIDLVF